MEYFEDYGVGLILFFYSFLILIYGIHLHRVPRKIKRDGFAVTADLMEKKSYRRGRVTVCKFFVSYGYEGMQYDSKVEVSVEEYGKYPVGSQIPVILLPNKPQKCYAESFVERSAPVGVYVYSALLFVCGLLLILFSVGVA